MMQDVKRGDSEANFKMMTFLKALKQGISTCPLVQRSLDIITNGLQSEVNTNTETALEDVITDQSYLPAFPYYDPSLSNNAGLYQQGIAFDDPLLDCFPEAHFSNEETSRTWFYPVA